VVHDHPVSRGKPAAAGTDRDDLTARLMTGDDALVRLRTLAEVLAVDGADVTAADRRRLHLQQDLTVARFGNVDLDVLHGAVARQDDSVHGGHDGPSGR